MDIYLELKYGTSAPSDALNNIHARLMLNAINREIEEYLTNAFGLQKTQATNN